MRLTLNNISIAVKEKTGLDVRLHRGDGCFHFYSDDEEMMLKLMTLPSTTVYTRQLGSHTIAGWVERFELLWSEFDPEPYDQKIFKTKIA